MLSIDFRHRVEELLMDITGVRSDLSWTHVGTGVGGSRWRVKYAERYWFVKVLDDAARVSAEADGLAALARCGAVKVPQLIGTVSTDAEAGVILDWLPLAPGQAAAAARLGAQLAKQHRCIGSRFGWPTANFIGATPQFNTPGDDWAEFFRDHRLGFQLRLAAENGFRGALQELGVRLLERLTDFFSGYQPQPALLHGDLWGGNWGMLVDGSPVIFDPAVYYGDREADLAMTELFGGFPAGFYAAYQHAFPLASGYRPRRDLYNLYHLLNHLNLFGDGYLMQVERVLRGLLAILN